MSIYLLTYLCPNIVKPAAFKMAADATIEQATALRETLPANRACLIASTPEELKGKMSGPLAVKIYNELLKTHVNPKLIADSMEPLQEIKKFESLGKAAERIFRVMIDVAVDAPAEFESATETDEAPAEAEAPKDEATAGDPADTSGAAEGSTTEEGTDDMAKAKKKTAKKRAAKTGGARKSAFSPDAKIKVLKKENPRREGTRAHKMFEKYSSGMTVAEALKKGVTTKDLRWDIHDGNISIG